MPLHLRLVDGMIVGAGADEGRLAGFINTAEDRIRVPWRGGALRYNIAFINTKFTRLSLADLWFETNLLFV